MFCIHGVDCSRFSIKSGLWSACILVIKKNIIRTRGGLIARLIVFRSLVRMLFLFSVDWITGFLLQNLLADDLLVSRRRRIIRHGPALLPDVLPPGHLLVCLPPWVPHRLNMPCDRTLMMRQVSRECCLMTQHRCGVGARHGASHGLVGVVASRDPLHGPRLTTRASHVGSCTSRVCSCRIRSTIGGRDGTWTPCSRHIGSSF